MSSSSTTACSRSPSPATPATPESSDNVDPVVTQEDLAAWCHSLSPAGFLIGDESHFSDSLKKKRATRPLDLEESPGDDSLADDSDTPFFRANPPISSSTPSGPETPSKFLSVRSPSMSLPMGIEVADLIRSRASIPSNKPIPPLSLIRRDPTSGSQCVVYPPKESCYNLPIMIPSIPEGGTKSRVETQVRLTVDLAHASTSSGEPLKYDRVGSWKWLRLAKGTSTKKRARKESKVDAPPEETLHLTTEITCASPPHTRVTCCSSCQGREAKRVARKLAARVRPARSDSDSPDDIVIIPGRGKHEDHSNLVQFNCPEVLDFSSGSVVLPLRITCYCRHHREKVGFNVHFTMLDHNGRVVGSGTTRPIMITDDHKSTGVNKSAPVAAVAPNAESLSPKQEWSLDLDGNQSGRKNSLGTERTKKRAKPYDGAGRAGKIRRKGSTSSLSGIVSPMTSAVATRAPTRASTPAQPFMPTSPLQSSVSSPESIDTTSAEVAASLFSAAFEMSASPMDTSVQRAFEDVIMPDVQPQIQLDLHGPTISLEELTNPSTFMSGMSPEPMSSMAMSLNPGQTINVASPEVSYMLFNHDPPPPITTLPPPKIHRLIPSSGPTYGGIEVTVLGANFHPAMQLNCVFGDISSSSTHRWSDNTLVCLLPPTTSPGVVAVWFDGIQKEEDGSPPSLFAYTDETDRALMELALQVVGLKMTGKIEDARNVAMRIVSTTGSDETQSPINPANLMQMATSPVPLSDIRHLFLTHGGDNGDFEKMVLNFLAILDLPMQTTSGSLTSAISHTTSSGQTLLHLSVFLNFPSIVKFLLAHGIDFDARDKNGYTALHFSALKKSLKCARLLVEAGAALDVVNALGKTPAELAPHGFFNRLYIDSDSSVSDVVDEEEGAWADAEEESSDEEITTRTPLRRRPERKSVHWRERPSRRSSNIDLKSEKDSSLSSGEAKKAAEAVGLVDEKQVMATIMDVVQRTLAQLQHPQGMIPHIPNLPQLRHLAGMPAWGVLPQMPTVFPVFVPISALPIPALPIPPLSTLWEKRSGHQNGGVDDDKSGKHQQWLGIPTAQEWRGMWEKWITLATLTARPTEEGEAPPAYTPRESEEVVEKVEIVDGVEPIPPPVPQVSSTSTSRPVAYDAAPVILEEEVKSYGYRPAKKQTRRTQKKNDRMLVLFWIPILFIGMIWAFLHAMRVGFNAMRAVLTVEMGLLRA